MRPRPPLWLVAAVLAGIAVVAGVFAVLALLSDGEDVLTVAIPSFGPEILDPSLESEQGLLYHGHVYDHLMGVTEEGRLSPQAGLLDFVRTGSDGKSFALRLRQGMKWHDGREITAEDVQFSMGYYTREEATCGVCETLRAALDRVVVTDRYTADIHLKEADVEFLHLLGPVEGDAPLLPKHHWESEGEPGLAENPIGSGPWKFSERKLGEHIEFEANRDYWDGQRIPAFDKLRLVQVENATERLAMLRAGGVDMTIVGIDDVEPLKEEGFSIAGPKHFIATTLRYFMSYDPSYLTSDPNFRKALALGTDLEPIINAVYPAEAATLASGSPLFNPLTEGYDATLPPYSYDPVEAQRLLQQAGYGGETVYLVSVVAYGLTEMLDMNQMLAEDWREIGLNVEVMNTEWPPIRARALARPQEFDDLAPATLLHGAFPYNSRFNTIVQRYMSSVEGGLLTYHNPARGDMIYQGLSTIVDPAEREEQMLLLNRETYDEYWALPIVWRHQPYALSSGLTGWQPTNGTTNSLRLETVRPSE